MVSGVQGSNIIVVQKSAEAVSSSTKGARRSYQNTADAWRKQGACGAFLKDVQISISIPGMCCQLPLYFFNIPKSHVYVIGPPLYSDTFTCTMSLGHQCKGPCINDVTQFFWGCWTPSPPLSRIHATYQYYLSRFG